MAREIETEAQGPVWALTTVPAGDRELLVRGGADGMVRLIDAGSGETVRSLSGHAGPVRSLAVIPAGGSSGFGVLASGGVDGTVRIWSLGDYELQHEVRFLDGEVWALVPLRLGERMCLAGTGSGSLIQLWDPSSGRQLRTLGETGGRIWALAQVAVDHGELLVSGAADGTIRFWDPRTGQAVQTIKAHESTVWALAAVPGPDGELLASGGADGVVRLWRPGSARTVRAFAGHASTVRALAVVPTGEGEVLASGSADSTVRLWRLDGSDSAPAHTFSGHFGEVWALAPVRVAGRMLLASGGVDGTIQLVDPTTYRTESLLLAGASTVWALSSVALADRTLLASGGVDGTMLLTNLDTRIAERSLRGHTSTIRALTTVPAVGGSGPAESPLVASGGADGTIRVWPVDSDDPRRVLTGHRGEVWALAATVVDGSRRLVSGGADGTVRLWPVDSDGAGVVLGRHEGEVGALATLAGRTGAHIVASGGTDGKVILWETAAPATRDNRRLAQLDQAGLGGVTALAAVPLPAGVRLACALSSGGVTLWDPERGELLGELAGSRRQPARALASIRVGRQVLVAAGGQDGVVRLWDPVSREGVGELRGHQGTVRALAGAELTGQPVLASASDDGEVRLWDLSTRSYISTVSSGARPSTHIVSDRPSTTDTLGRRAMVDALQDFLTDPSTAPPIVIGVHGPWGYGKTSVLTQLRARLDPDQPDVGWSEPRQPTYELVWDDPKDLGRLSAWGAWRRLERRKAAMTDGLGCRLRELGLDGPRERTRISVWFSPWMYPTREELWAGLARELLTSITHRVPREDREKLWFDLNLRRTDPQLMRRRILKSFVPRSPAGIMLAVLSFAVIVTALVAETYLLWSQHLKPLLAGLLVGFPLVGLLAKVVWTALRGTVKHVLPPEVLSGPTPTGTSANGRNRSPETRDALYESEAGYLYLIQHDVRHIVRLATAEEPIVVFIDDLDRCSSEIVSSTMEAINLFMNNAFGECIFVVALDPATIAAHLEVSHDAIRRRIEERPVTYAHLGDIGWRFMEKIVDLPIRLPRLPDKAVSAYAAALVTPATPRRPNGAPATAAGPAVPPNGSPRSKAAAVPAPAGPPYPQVSTPPERALSPAGRDTATAVTATAARPPSPVEAVTPATAAAVADTVERIETIREVSDALRDAMLELPRRNPQEMKRFLNLWRFYLGVESRTDQLPADVDGLVVHGRSVARLVQIMLRWPKYLDRLGELHAGRTVLADLLAAAGDPESWHVALHRAGMESAEAELASLRELLDGGDPELAELSKRYL